MFRCMIFTKTGFILYAWLQFSIFFISFSSEFLMQTYYSEQVRQFFNSCASVCEALFRKREPTYSFVVCTFHTPSREKMMDGFYITFITFLIDSIICFWFLSFPSCEALQVGDAFASRFWGPRIESLYRHNEARPSGSSWSTAPRLTRSNEWS